MGWDGISALFSFPIGGNMIRFEHNSQVKLVGLRLQFKQALVFNK